MAVRLLAGPFLIKETETGEVAQSMVFQMWWPNVGLIVKATFPKKNSTLINVVTLDGVSAEIMDRSLANYFNKWGWWPAYQKVVGMYGPEEYVVEPFAFATQKTHPSEQPPNWSNFYYRYVRLLDRRIYFFNGRIYRQVNGVATDAPESEMFTSLLFITFITGEVHPGRNDHEVFVSDSYFNQACFYDTAAQKILAPVYYFGMPCEGIVYVPEYGVIVTGHSETMDPPPDPANPDKKWAMIRVWSLEVEPTAVTPVVVVGASKSGGVTTYQVRVTGAQGEPAPQNLVNWTLTGAGVLLVAQSETDKDGYATTQVQYQLDEIGQSVVDASVAC